MGPQGSLLFKRGAFFLQPGGLSRRLSVSKARALGENVPSDVECRDPFTLRIFPDSAVTLCRGSCELAIVVVGPTLLIFAQDGDGPVTDFSVPLVHKSGPQVVPAAHVFDIEG